MLVSRIRRNGLTMNSPDLIDQQASRRHWDQHLDPQNLRKDVQKRDYQAEWDFYFSDEARFALKHFPPLNGAHCLELGAGLGTFALYLATRGATVIATDFSFERLRALNDSARELGVQDRIRCVQCAAEHLPVKGDQCNVAFTKSVLIHTRLPEALAEVRRVLAPDGKAIFMEPFGANPFAALVRRFFAPQEWKAFTRYFDEWSAGEIEKVFPATIRRPFYLFGFLAFIWQFHWPHLLLFKGFLTITRPLDRLLFAIFRPFHRFAWFNVFVSRKNL